MCQLIVRLLGPPTVEWEGILLPIPRRKVRALFYRLALELQPIAREHLTYLFWADKADAAAHRDLTHLLTHLRNALPRPDLVQCTADYVFLDPRRIWCDAIDLLRVLRCHHAEPAAANLIAAAALVRGPLLDGFVLNDCPEFEEWLTIERSVWERRQRAVVDALARAGRNAQDMELLLPHASFAPQEECLGEATTHMDPETHSQLIAAHLAAGNMALVRRQMEACRNLVDLPHFALGDRERSK
jgi:DNA-binding SARP family transcriptional activator